MSEFETSTIIVFIIYTIWIILLCKFLSYSILPCVMVPLLFQLFISLIPRLLCAHVRETGNEANCSDWYNYCYHLDHFTLCKFLVFYHVPWYPCYSNCSYALQLIMNPVLCIQEEEHLTFFVCRTRVQCKLC